MKTMIKKRLKVQVWSMLIFLFSAGFISCEDDVRPEIPNGSFSYLGETIETPNAYLFLDDGPQYTDGYFFVLTDGAFIEDNVNGASAETSTTKNAVALFVYNSQGTVASEQAVSIIPGNHILDSESAMLKNINAWDDTHMVNGKQYGEANGAQVEFSLGSGVGTITIQSVSIDYVARTGNINLTYNMANGSSGMVTGYYSGSFELINEF